LQTYVAETPAPVLQDFLKEKATLIRTDQFPSSQQLKTGMTKKFNSILHQKKKTGHDVVNPGLWEETFDPVST
jgi:hypothetical protein